MWYICPHIQSTATDLFMSVCFRGGYDVALQHVEAVQTPQEYGGCEGAEGLPHQRVDKLGHG